MLSVVVAVTDANAALLADCLQALDHQHRPADELLVVVTGTSPDTHALVEAQRAARRRLLVRRLPGGSPADALTAGARWACGDHLLLLHAGDQPAPALLGSLERAVRVTGADVALAGPDDAALPAPDLAAALLRRSWWRRAGLGVPDGPAGEWATVVRAVTRAGVWAPVRGPVRLGPRRGTGAGFGAAVVRAPFVEAWGRAVAEALGAVAGDRWAPERAALVRWLLAVDAADYLEDAERCTPRQWSLLREVVARLWGEADVRAVPVEQRVRAWLAVQDRRADLEALCAARWHEAGQLPTRLAGGRVLAVLPVVGVPEEVLEVHPAESPLVTSVRRLRWTPEGRLEAELAAYVRHVGRQLAEPEVEVRLLRQDGREIALEPRPLVRPEVEQLAGERFADHAADAYAVVVDPAVLAAAGPARWRIAVTWRAGGLARTATVTEGERRGGAAGLTPRHVGGRWVGFDAETAAVLVRDEAPAGRTDEDRPRLDDLRLDGDRLLVRGTTREPVTAVVVTGPNGEAAAPATHDAATFTAAVPLRHDPWGLGESPLPPGGYRLAVRTASGRSRPALAVPLLERTPFTERSPVFRLRVERHPDGGAALGLAAPLADDEAGPRAQQRLRERYAVDDRPLDPRLVYLQSYAGQAPTDSPLAIHHALRRLRPDLRPVWGLADGSVRPPEGGEAVLLRSRAWYDVLATCGHLVTNIDMDDWFRKRPGQRLLQTYHGYPSKAMGIMAWEAKDLLPSRVERLLRRTSGTWDLLLTPVPEMDRHYREQYRWAGPIHSEGYPRDDALVAPDAARVREDTRRRLGIGDRTAVLYAPTWRDDLATAPRAAALPSALDVDRLAAGLGDDHVLLLRGHRFHRRRPGTARHGVGRLLDVTGYPEVNDLILAADAAVLDYSSLRFDFALTGRPMVFHVPDLERYAHGVRGFLYPFEETAPGPLLRTTGEVLAALRDLEGVRRAHHAGYRAFNQRFNVHHDGLAADRVVRAFFGGPGE